ELARTIAKERSRREIQPTMRVFKEVSSIEDDGNKKTQELIKKTKEMHEFVKTADAMLNRMVNQEQNWVTKTLVKFLK
nr:transcriptional regulator [Flavobacteriaceae bacterium]